MNKLVMRDIKKNFRLFSGTIIAVALTVSIISACMSLILSAVALKDYGHRFDGVDLVVKMDNQVKISYVKGGDEEEEFMEVYGNVPFGDSDIARLSSKYDCILDYAFYVEPVDLTFNKIAGHNQESMGLTDFELMEGVLPGFGDILIDENLADNNKKVVGDSIAIKFNEGIRDYRISGIVSTEVEDAYVLQNYVFFDEAEARAISNKCYSIGIITDDIERTEDKITQLGYRVFYDNNINQGELSHIVEDDMTLMIVFITLGALCLMISLFVISGTIQFSVRNRFRSLALLRGIGFTRGQVIRFLKIQSLVISIIGGSFGIWMSFPLVRIIVDAFVDIGIIGADFVRVRYGYVDLAIIICMAALVSWITGLTAKKPLSVSPANAISGESDMNSTLSPSSVIIGIVLIIGGFAVMRFTSMIQGTGIGMSFIVISLFLSGAMLISPLLMQVINFILSLFMGNLYNSMGHVACANIKTKASKFAVASVSLAIMVSMGTTMILNNITYMNVIKNSQYSFAKAYDYVAYDINPTEMGTQAFMGYRAMDLRYNDHDSLEDLETIAIVGEVPDLDYLSDNPSLEADEILISDRIKNYRVGDEMEIWLEDGQAKTVTVSGIYDSKNIRSEQYSSIMRYEDVYHSFFDHRVDLVYLDTPIPGATEHTLSMYDNHPNYDIQLGVALLIGGIGILLSIIALFNTLAIIMSVRRKEFNGLKLIGATRRQVFKMTFWETIVVMVTGLVIGLSVLFITVGTYSVENTGTYDWIVDRYIFFGGLIGALILGLLAGIMPSISTIIKLKKQYRVA